MPGSVETATAVGVMPFTLCTAFVQERTYTALDNEYKNGESQRSKVTETSRRVWRLSKRLKPSDLAELRTFYDDHDGGLQAFYFYDVFETDPPFVYDETGAATVGRYKVCFRGRWKQSAGISRIDIPDLVLAEIV